MMTVGIEKWPGGRWIAHRSQQGWHGKHITLGPLQINWYSGFRVYVTWPTPVILFAVRRPDR